MHEFDAADARPKAIHRCRVHLKRARALARIGRACAPGLSTVFTDSARTTMGVLARARDLTAQADAARAMARPSGKRVSAALLSVAAHIEREQRALPPLHAETVRTALTDLLALAQVWPEASARQIKRGAKHIVARARGARKKGAASDEPARRHRWRKREKDRYYAALLLCRAFPAKRRRKQGEELGEALGRERDALLLLERIGGEPGIAGGDSAAARAIAAVAKRQKRLRERADAIGARLHANGA